MFTVKKSLIYFLSGVISLLGFGLFYSVEAASLTNVSDSISTIQSSTLASHAIAFTLGGSTALDSDETVTIDFDEDGGKFVVAGAATVVGDLSFNDGVARNIVGADGSCAGHVGANDIAAQVNDTTGLLTFTACGSYAPRPGGATTTINYGTSAGGTNRITNPVAGTYIINVVAALDTGSFAENIIDNNQIAVAALVDPTISFGLDHTSTDFGTITTAVKTASPNIVLTTSTNAIGGYNITIQDQGSGTNPGLYNATAAYLVGSANAAYDNTADLGAAAGYGVQGSSATDTIAASYDQSGTTVGGYKRTAQLLATFNGVADNHDVTLVMKAKVLGSAPAGSYADTITAVATGNF